MTLIDVLFFSVIFGLIEGLKTKNFRSDNFLKAFITVFMIGLIFIICGKLFLNHFMEQYLPGEKFGVWVFGTFLILYSIFAAVKGFINKV